MVGQSANVVVMYNLMCVCGGWGGVRACVRARACVCVCGWVGAYMRAFMHARARVCVFVRVCRVCVCGERKVFTLNTEEDRL